MKQLIASIIFAATSLVASAAPMTGWSTVAVPDTDKPVGYIMHTYAIGTQTGKTTEKVVAGLRLICSTKNTAEPLIAIYWSGWLYGSPTRSQFLWSAVNGKALSSDEWMQDTKILYRTASQAKTLIDAMKTSRTVQFTWVGADAVKYNVMFDTVEFNAKLIEFNASCKTQI